MKYYAEVINSQGCVFDTAKFNSIRAANKWASGRGKCKLRLSRVNELGERHTSHEYDKR